MQLQSSDMEWIVLHEKKEASIEEIRNWKVEIEKGVKPSSLAQSIFKGKQMEGP